MADLIKNLQAMLDAGQDSALLRFTLGSQFFKQESYRQAVEHLRAALEQDQGYSAAWKMLGKALQASGEPDGARDAYISGIAAAEQKGDLQAAREMKVFLKRTEKALTSGR